ncbi:MAG: 30S ribosome-binding factor RbfA [Bowdeniella nasicola]|nr:30S ribosome-binding factor RbfA [Bowdeniella nasicola]
MADQQRARRLAERIKVIVAEVLDRRVKDPRLGFVTITDVRVTGDLQHATVFYTVLGDNVEESAAALHSARGLIRSEVGKGTGVRLTPTLEFVADALPQSAAQIDEALRRAAEADAALAESAHGKPYAGEANPYRTPHADE